METKRIDNATNLKIITATAAKFIKISKCFEEGFFKTNLLIC